MEIRFTKGTDIPGVLACKRPEGTVSWKKVDYSTIDRDFAHYAVESLLDYHRGIFGLIAKGMDFAALETEDDLDPYAHLPLQAQQVGIIVQLLLDERRERKVYDDFNDRVKFISMAKGIETPAAIPPARLIAVRKTLIRLREAWGQLEPEQSIIVYFTERD